MPWVPNLIMGLISLAVAFVTLMLPETKDWPLPQSIADVYRYTRGEHRARADSLRNDVALQDMKKDTKCWNKAQRGRFLTHWP